MDYGNAKTGIRRTGSADSVNLLKGDLRAYNICFMGIAIEEIAEAALSLPLNERAMLADRLAQRLEPLDEEERIRDAWTREALRRLEEVESGLIEPIDGSDGLARIRLTLSRARL